MALASWSLELGPRCLSGYLAAPVFKRAFQAAGGDQGLGSDQIEMDTVWCRDGCHPRTPCIDDPGWLERGVVQGIVGG